MSEHETEHKETSISKYKLIILIILIFVMAFSIRGHLLKYDYMYEYDPYWHLRATGYILQDGGLPDNDPLGFYQQGGSPYGGGDRPLFLWYFTAIIYSITTFGAGYSKWLLMDYARVLPAVFGALISVAMYFLGKEIYNRKTGFVMAVVAATIPAFVYRTMAGFFEDDALGFLWLIIGFIFLVKAIKNLNSTKKYIIYSLVSAAFFIIMAATWGMFILIPLVLIAYFIVNVIYMAYTNATNKEIGSFVTIFLIIMALFTVGATLVTGGTTWIKNTTYYVTQYIPISSDNIARLEKTNIDSQDVIGATVGEENTGRQFFLQKYSFFLWVPFAALLAIIIYLFTTKKKDYITWVLFFWIAITLFMAWSKLKFTYTLGIPIAVGAGVLFYLVSEWIENKSIGSKRAYVIGVTAVLLISIAAGSFFVSTNVPPIDEQPEWKETVFWLHDNTDLNANIFNWWDYGHWIAYFSERKVATDNTNSYVKADKDVAMFLITDDANKAKSILKEYNADYIPIEQDYFRRLGSFGMYAYWTTNTNDPRITKYFGAPMPCTSYKTDISGSTTYSCGGNTIPEEEFLKLPDTWQSTPNELMQNTPVYIYRDTNNTSLYIFNAAANNTMLARIWFSDSSLDEMVNLIHANGVVRVYKVNKDKLN